MNHRGDTQDSADKFINMEIDKMFERTLKPLLLHHADLTLDDTTLEKPGKLAMPSPTGSVYTRPAVSSSVMVPSQLSRSFSDSIVPIQPRGRTVVHAKQERNRPPGMKRGGKMGQGGQPQIPTPPVDPDNEEFVIFVRSKSLPMWVPCTMIKGTSAANQLVKQFGQIGQNLAKDTLVRNIGESVYGNSKELIKAARKSSLNLKYATAFEFGFKIRDKTKPTDWFIPKDIIVLPPKDQLPQAPLAGAQNALSNVKDSLSNMFGGKSD